MTEKPALRGIENATEQAAAWSAAWQGWTPQDILAQGLADLGERVALASSFGAEDMVLIDMLYRLQPTARVFTLDTGRLPYETYDLLATVQKRYPELRLRVMYPDTAAVEEMVQTQGINLFYESVENRKRCCYVRKVEPLGRALADLDGWITGLRRDQTANRGTMAVVEADTDKQSQRPIFKFNPLLEWTWEQVWDYLKTHGVPYNALHDRGYPSIGCAPCTRAVAPDEDPRAGRWWWEQDNQECGLHVTADGRLVRAKG
ncbi:MAG: phosphoadenylyl-sulfate reductase [Oscillatoriales cyanobacterium SM2_1_8]|nr:phosphoadenylyl-sulfate reductase [Oscillatoriales cyanobacterium SM2_1_8]